MKIAYVTARFPYRGAELFFEPEIRMLGEMGHEVLVVPTRPGSDGAPYDDGGYNVLRVGLFEARILVGAFSQCLHRDGAALSALEEVAIHRYRFASKIKNLAVFPKAAGLARYLADAGVEHIHAHWLSTPSTVAYVASRITGIPWSCTAHRFDLFEDNLIDVKTRSAKFTRVISKRGQQVLEQRVGSPAADRLRLAHIGVCVPRRPCIPQNDGALQILCPANFVPVKGHEYLIRALQRLRARGVCFHCDLAGDGPLRAAIERDIERAGLRRVVRLRGHIEHNRLCAQLAEGRYDLVVLPSTESGTTFEGIPVALMEAMAAAVPCVATRTGSIPELIDDQRCSRLVPQRDPEALAQAIEELALDGELRAALGQRARTRILEEFDVRRTTEQFLAMIDQR